MMHPEWQSVQISEFRGRPIEEIIQETGASPLELAALEASRRALDAQVQAIATALGLDMHELD